MPRGVYVRTGEYRQKIGAASRSAWQARRDAGLFNSDSYSTIHKYLASHYVKDGICISCGPARRTEWALLHGREHSRNIDDYQEMCHSCHMRYDQLGHEVTQETRDKIGRGNVVSLKGHVPWNKGRKRDLDA